jgi:hypothetical protein
MSRLLILPLLLICSAADAQSLSDAELAEMIAKQRRTVSIDADGCLKNPNDEDDVIVVCGEPEENRRQKLPPQSAGNDRIRRGEAVSTTKAAAKDNRNCGVIGAGLGCITLPKNNMRFGSVPPPAIPLEEVYRGLPEPDMVVTEGSAQQQATPTTPQ